VLLDTSPYFLCQESKNSIHCFEINFLQPKKTPVSELQAIKKNMWKKILKDFPEGKGIKCWYTGKELLLKSCSGLNMLSIDQGDSSMKSDDQGQTWYVCSWGINWLKGSASTQQLRRFLEELQGIPCDHSFSFV
jgi:hypothetical protein